jgi:hypothetical protein
MQRRGGAQGEASASPCSFGVSPRAWASVLSPERAFDLSGTSNSDPLSRREVVSRETFLSKRALGQLAMA